MYTHGRKLSSGEVSTIKMRSELRELYRKNSKATRFLCKLVLSVFQRLGRDPHVTKQPIRRHLRRRLRPRVIRVLYFDSTHYAPRARRDRPVKGTHFRLTLRESRAGVAARRSPSTKSHCAARERMQGLGRIGRIGEVRTLEEHCEDPRQKTKRPRLYNQSNST